LSEIIPEDNCLGSEYITKAAIVDIMENPDHDACLTDITSPEGAKEFICHKLTEVLAHRIHWTKERIKSFESGLDYNEDEVFKAMVGNNWHGLRLFLAGLKDELDGSSD
jgi:hypothetical protein